MSQRKYKRRIKIIKPRLQLKLVGIFVGLAALSVLLQSVLLAHRMTELSAEIPVGGQYIVDALPGILLEILVFTFGLVLPLIFAVGVLVTHRIAGPVYRFEQYLSQVARGEAVGPCRIRSGDELQELCEVINRATAAVQSGSPDAAGDDAEGGRAGEPVRRAG